MLVQCDCGVHFDPRAKKFGLVNQCNTCGQREEKRRKVKRYLGRKAGDSKHAVVVVYRENLDEVRRVLRRENACGVHPNLPFSPQSNPFERPE